MATSYSPYEHGYCVGAAGQPRKAPASVRNPIPSLSAEWFRGYDDARRANEAERARMLAGFVTNS